MIQPHAIHVNHVLMLSLLEYILENNPKLFCLLRFLKCVCVAACVTQCVWVCETHTHEHTHTLFR